MNSYRAFDLLISSEFQLPGLPRCEDQVAPVVRIIRGRNDVVGSDAVVVGEDPDPPCNIRLLKGGDGFRLEHRCTGVHDFIVRDSLVICDLAPDVTDEAMSLDIINRLLPLVLHSRGILCLHASALAIDGQVVAFVAAKGSGKSTLALALTHAGAELVSDDALAIEIGEQISALPGVPVLRLKEDVGELARAHGHTLRHAVDGKVVLDARDSLGTIERIPLGAIYVLHPVDATQGSATVRREKLGYRESIATLLAHGKLGALLGGIEGVESLDRVIRLLSRVPLYRLSVPRDLSMLHEVAQSVVDWHAVDGHGSC